MNEVVIGIRRLLVGLLIFLGALLIGIGFCGDYSGSQILTGFIFLGLAGLLASLILGRT